MKTNVTLRNVLKGIQVIALFTATSFAQAQSGPGGGPGSGGSGSQSIPELSFKNHQLESGTDGADGAIYRFKQVAGNVDARIKVVSRSSSLVTIENVDIDNTGNDNAFQPQITYNNGNAGSNKNWWVDLDINFVSKGTNTPVAVSSFNLTALDIDGDGGSLNEYVSFFNATSYTVESNTLLSIQNIWQTILSILTPGREFDGPKTNYDGIDVNATRVMTTLTFNNKNSFRIRIGGNTGSGSSSAADRMYSFWFKGFNFNTPVNTTLPMKLTAFTATLNNSKVDLKWTTSFEKGVDHFTIEKSFDGKNFSDLGLVFAYGNTAGDVNYNFVDDNISSNTGMIYYRLRSVDVDSKSDYSDIRLIRLSKQTDAAIALVAYPNPVTSDLRVTIPSSWQGKRVNYEVVNNSGQIALRKEVGSGSQTESLSMSQLPTGFYIVRASCEGQLAQQKLIKQ